MEVCIFGVLTVNLLTFPSRNAPSCIRTFSLLKPVFRWLAELWKKSPNALLEPVLRPYMMTGKRHK